MRNGIVGTPLDLSIPFAKQINAACVTANWFPYVVSAIQHNETGGLSDAATVVSADGGHGLMQLTSSFPANWDDPYANALYAIDEFLRPAETYWSQDFQGNDLIRAIAAEFNAGRTAVINGHAEGDLGKYTTNSYDQRALQTYTKLLAGEAV
jgi:hypothetical protein